MKPDRAGIRWRGGRLPAVRGHELHDAFLAAQALQHDFLCVKNPRTATTLILITARPRLPSSIFNPLSRENGFAAGRRTDSSRLAEGAAR
jgi:hypothetical protein